jgi:hypothetical protein
MLIKIPNCFITQGASLGIGRPLAGNAKGGSITVPLTSCLTGLDSVAGLLNKKAHA